MKSSFPLVSAYAIRWAQRGDLLWMKRNEGADMLTLELRMSHFCDARGHPLSAAVAILQQSNEVALTVRS